MTDLKKLVIDKIGDLGVAKSKEFFGVSCGTISNWASGKTDPSLEAAQKVLELTGTACDSSESEIYMWEGKDVIMLLPVYRGFSADTHYTLFANYAKYGPDKIGMLMEKRTVIHESRNMLVHKARKIKPKYVIMTDDDMILPCGSPDLFQSRYGASGRKGYGFNAISRIMSHPEDKRIVGGLYFGRNAMGKAQCCSGFSSESENQKLRSGQYDNLKPEEWIGTGFLRIHMSVFDDMQNAIDSGKWPECKPMREGMPYGFFNPLRVGVGEDVSFGRRATELGIRSYLDTSLVLLHNGEQFYGPHNTRG